MAEGDHPAWMYKDLGRQGLTYPRPDSPSGALVADLMAKKMRFGVDQWGSTGRECPEITQPLVAREAPGFDPYPWRRFDWIRTLAPNITLVQDYADLFDDDEWGAFAGSFAFANCGVRETLRDQLALS